MSRNSDKTWIKTDGAGTRTSTGSSQMDLTNPSGG